MAKQFMVQVNSTQELVYRTLRQEILSMALLPGTIISTQEVSDRLHVSRTPVREAFIRLQKEALLEVAPQRATTVSLIDLERVHQERFIRQSLEMENLEQFITQATEETIAQLRANIALQKEAIAQGDGAECIELDNWFHQKAFYVTGQSLSAELLQQMNGHYDRIRVITTWEPDIVPKNIEQHEVLLEAVAAKDVALAKKLYNSHLHNLDWEEVILLERWSQYIKG